MNNVVCLFFILFLINACVSPLKINTWQTSANFQHDSVERNSVFIACNKDVNVPEICRTFRREYGSDVTFAGKLTQLVSESMQDHSVIVTHKDNNTSDVSRLLNATTLSARHAALKVLGDSNKLVLVISKVTVDKEVELVHGNAGMMVSNGTMMHASAPKYETNILVRIDAVLWDVEKNEKLLDCSSYGKSTLLLIAYDAALRSSMEKAVNNLTDFVVSGKR